MVFEPLWTESFPQKRPQAKPTENSCGRPRVCRKSCPSFLYGPASNGWAANALKIMVFEPLWTESFPQGRPQAKPTENSCGRPRVCRNSCSSIVCGAATNGWATNDLKIMVFEPLLTDRKSDRNQKPQKTDVFGPAVASSLEGNIRPQARPQAKPTENSRNLQFFLLAVAPVFVGYILLYH